MAALLVAASAMSRASADPAGDWGNEGEAGDAGGCAPGTAGAIAVEGNWLPPDISAVLASGATPGGGVSSSSEPESGGAKTVAGSGTDMSSPAPLVSVPAQGVAPAGTSAEALGS